MSEKKPISISLYEFYTMGLAGITDKAPWEKGPKITKYHQSFVTEERLLAMSVLYFLGESYVPAEVLNTMATKYREQVRDSVNQAVFSRALKRHYHSKAEAAELSSKTMRQMESYVTCIHKSQHDNEDPLDPLVYTLAKRVPPQNKQQLKQYEASVDQILNYVEKMSEKTLKTEYKITEL